MKDRHTISTVASTAQRNAIRKAGKTCAVLQKLVADFTGIPGPKRGAVGRPRKTSKA